MGLKGSCVILLSALMFSVILWVPMENVKAEVNSFQIRGADLSVDVFAPNSNNYRSDAWTYVKDLNLNLLRCFPEVESYLGINMNTVPNWARNLDAFLAQAKANDCKILFSAMGSSMWGPEMGLGLVGYPHKNPRQGSEWNPWESLGYMGTWMYFDAYGNEIVGTPIADAKVMIDVLTGSITADTTLPSGAKVYGNHIGHNFITDSRIWGWETSSEQDLGNSVALDWNVQLLDYIRSEGGKAWAAAPYDNTAGYWNATKYAKVLGSHSDVIELHYYGEYDYINSCDGHNSSVSDATKQSRLYNIMKPQFAEMLSTSFPADKVFLGEFGCWIGGPRSAEGLSNVTFTNQDRINIYTSSLNAAKDAGLQNVCFHTLFSSNGIVSDYGLVKANIDGSGYWDANLASLIRAAYYTENDNSGTSDTEEVYIGDVIGYHYPPQVNTETKPLPSSQPIPSSSPAPIPAPTTPNEKTVQPRQSTEQQTKLAPEYLLVIAAAAIIGTATIAVLMANRVARYREKRTGKYGSAKKSALSVSGCTRAVL